MDLHENCKILYLEYVNDFLTIEAFASYKGISEALAIAIVQHGQFIHENSLKG